MFTLCKCKWQELMYIAWEWLCSYYWLTRPVEFREVTYNNRDFYFESDFNADNNKTGLLLWKDFSDWTGSDFLTGASEIEYETPWFREIGSLLQVSSGPQAWGGGGAGSRGGAPWMFVLHFLPLNVDNLIHGCPEACFSTICEVPSFRTTLQCGYHEGETELATVVTGLRMRSCGE